MITGLKKPKRLRNPELRDNGLEGGPSTVIDSGRNLSPISTQEQGSEKVNRRSDRLRSAKLTNLGFQSNGLEDLGASKAVDLIINQNGDSVKDTVSRRTVTARGEGHMKYAKLRNAGVGGNVLEDVEKGAPILSIVKGRGEKEMRKVEVGFKGNEIKRKDPFEQLGVEGEIGDGEPVFGEVSGSEWSQDQEMALQRAYLIVKPCSNFWKGVAQMVPGKSPQECFDKINSTFATPPPPRSKKKGKTLSPLDHFQLSRHKLLEPFCPSTKKPKSSKQKALLPPRTVRHILRKHEHVDQENEADLFSVLETANSRDQMLPQMEMLATPDSMLKPCNLLQKCHKRLTLPKVENSNKQVLTSPEILKQVKNPSLHEKYIDQLHCREAKRRTEFCRTKKSISNNNRPKESFLQKAEIVKAAKTALVSDARDVLTQFRQIQTDFTNNYEDFDDDGDEHEITEDDPE